MQDHLIPSKGIISGISWSAFERFSVQGIQFVVFVLMARRLVPTDYGLVSMLAFFIVIAQLIAEGGLSQAIIRKLDRTEEDCSTAFWVNLAIGIGLYLILFVAAPLVSWFYEEAALTNLLRVLALCIVIQSTLVVHRAILTSRLDFKTQAKSTLDGALMSGLVGLITAYNGFGAWALVGLQLTNQVATAATLWIVTDWRPKWQFSSCAFRDLFGLGSKLLACNVLDSLFQSLYTLTIGKVFSAYALGCYSNARQLGSITSENLSRVVQRATYPMFCNFQNDIERLRNGVRAYLRLATFFIAPLMLGLAAIAEPLTLALIGPQWLYTARLLRILCFSFLFFPLNSINYMILEIKGEGGTYLKLQTFSVVSGLVILFVMLPFGLSAVCCGLFANSAIGYMVNSRVAGAKINLGFIRQVKSILPILINATIMGIVVYGVQTILFGEWLRVGVGILVGLLSYIGLSVVFQTSTCELVVELLRKKK